MKITFIPPSSYIVHIYILLLSLEFLQFNAYIFRIYISKLKYKNIINSSSYESLILHYHCLPHSPYYFFTRSYYCLITSSKSGSIPSLIISSTICCALKRLTSHATNLNIFAAVSFTTYE